MLWFWAAYILVTCIGIRLSLHLENPECEHPVRFNIRWL